MSRQVEVDLEQCIACQACVELCPAVFRMDSTENHALVLRSDLSGQEDCVQAAIDDCPVHCLHWLEA